MDNTAKPMPDNTKIDGAPPFRRSNGNEYWIGYSDDPDPEVSETKFAPCLQLDIKPKPKPDIFVNYRDSYRSGDLDLRSGDGDLDDYFVAYSLEEDGTLSPKYFIFIPTFLAEIDYYFTGASCNGLLHFYDEDSGNQALWNPTTGGYKVLPKPPVESDPDPLISYWFESYVVWYDHTFEDYKVLNLVAAYSDDDALTESYHIDLYSLKLNSWKRIPCPDYECADRSSAACVAGVFYCEATLKETRVILSFDFSTETLFSLPVPLPSPENLCDRYIFLEYKGLLSALACWYAEDEDTLYPVPLKYELWIMSDGLWTRESVFHTHGVETPLWFSQDGKLLYFASSIDELVVFDRATGELKRLGIDWSSADGRSEPKMIPFYESFVQLN